MSSGCSGSQLEVLYSQIKVAIFQPCERRARPQMETSFSGGLYWLWSSQWLVEHWNCGVTILWRLQVCKLISISNLWRICVCFLNSLEDLSRSPGFNQFLAPDKAPRLFDGPHSLPSQWARHGQPPKDPWVAGGFYGWIHIHQTDRVKDVKCKLHHDAYT